MAEGQGSALGSGSMPGVLLGIWFFLLKGIRLALGAFLMISIRTFTKKDNCERERK